MKPMTPKELAALIRKSVLNLNDLLILAALQEVDVEFHVRYADDAGEPTRLIVYVSQEV